MASAVEQHHDESQRIRARQRAEDVLRDGGNHGDPLVCVPPAFGYAGLKRYPALIESHTKSLRLIFKDMCRTADIPERALSIPKAMLKTWSAC